MSGNIALVAECRRLVARGKLGALDRNLKRRLRELGFDSPQADALGGITVCAAARSIAREGGPSAFLEVLRSSATLLARSDADPKQVRAELRTFANSLAQAVEPELRHAVERLYSTIIEGLDSAYLDLGDAEARALSELVRVCPTARNADDVWRRSLRACSDFSGASAAHLFLRQPSSEVFVLAARTLESGSASQRDSRALSAQEIRNLSRSFAAARKSSLSRYILDHRWIARWETCWSIPLTKNDGLAGVMQFGFATRRHLLARENNMLATLAAHCLSVAEQAERIASTAARENVFTQTARRVLQIEEIERGRVSRELHDDAGQSLVVIRLQMELLEQALPPQLSEIREQLAEIREITERTIGSVRRLISDLSPAVLEQFGLAAGVRQLARRFRQEYPCRLYVGIGKLPDVDNHFAILVYRVLQECLTNVARHSHAETVKISLTAADSIIRVAVQDDGVGFDAAKELSKPRRFGLAGIKERVALAGGTLAINTALKTGAEASGDKNPGTKIKINLPISKIAVYSGAIL
jgi:signal transduction histidine kinase